MNNNLEIIKKHIVDHLDEGINNTYNYLNKLYENPKVKNQLNNDEWDSVIDFTYQQLLAHSM